MRYNVFVVLFFVVVLMIGCSKQETLITGLTTETGQVVTETTVTVTDSKGSCQDSDDGITKETAGKVTGTLDGEEYTIYDRCMAGLLIEYYCEGNSYQNQNLRCPEGTECLGGACRSI